MGNYAHFSKDTGLWQESTEALWGSHDICLSLTWFTVGEITQLELLALSHAEAGGSIEKPQGDMAFLLIVPGKTIEGEMAFGLWWCGHNHTKLGSLPWMRWGRNLPCSLMGQLLMTRASMDACQRKGVSDFQTASHQNEAWTTKAIREAVHAAIRDAMACCTNIMQGAEATLQQPSGRWRLPVQNAPTLCSKLTGMVWRA